MPPCCRTAQAGAAVRRPAALSDDADSGSTAPLGARSQMQLVGGVLRAHVAVVAEQAAAAAALGRMHRRVGAAQQHVALAMARPEGQPDRA